jgi:FkbM family methyltransferase
MKKKYIIFGANNTAKYFLNNNPKIKCEFFVDNNENIKTFMGKPCFNTNILKKKIKNYILIICAHQFYTIFLQIKKLVKNIKFFFDYKNNKKIIFDTVSHIEDFEVASKLIKKNSIIIDIGGNTGLFSLFLFLKNKIKFSYIVEPQRKMCKSINILFKKFNFLNYKLINGCISSSKKKYLNFFIPRQKSYIQTGDASLILDHINWRGFNCDGESRYKERRIDTLKVRNLSEDIFNKNIVGEIGYKNIDFIKIDVEGAELECLNFLKKIIIRFRPTIYLEVYGPNFKNFIKLVNRSYDFYSIYQIKKKDENLKKNSEKKKSGGVEKLQDVQSKLVKVKDKQFSIHNFLIDKNKQNLLNKKY